MDIGFGFWDGVDKGAFLTNDRDNPARAKAAEIVRAEVKRAGHPLALVEVGPGPGIDYERFWRPMLEEGVLRECTLVDGSEGMVKYLRGRWPDADVQRGVFEDFLCPHWEVAYTKALFEHQPSLEGSLRGFLSAADRLAIVNFYRPPTVEGEKPVLGPDGCWYAVWRIEDVKRIAREAGWGEPTIHDCPAPGNQLWVWTRSVEESKDVESKSPKVEKPIAAVVASKVEAPKVEVIAEAPKPEESKVEVPPPKRKHERKR